MNAEMTQSKGIWWWRLGLASFVATSGALVPLNFALAQIQPDATLGAESSVVKRNLTINGLPSDRIDGGARRGINLFHSFRAFNTVDIGKRGVYFTNPPGVTNILSRVTGNSRSDIQGTLGVLGNANLFLINPNGVVFGSNASLDLKGSFLASTADSLNFANGEQFSAIDSQTTPLLSVSVPTGLQFGANPGRILNQSQASPNGSKNGFGLPVGLKVQAGKTLALVGGDVLLEGGNLTAEKGRIELGSVAGSSLISLTLTNQGIVLGYEGVRNFQDIQLTKRTIDGNDVPSFVTTETLDAGNAGDLIINAQKLIVRDGSQITTLSFGVFKFSPPDQFQFIPATGRGGNLTVNASESVELTGTASFGSFSGLTSSTTSAGDAGNITVSTGRLIIRDGGRIAIESTGVETPLQFIPATGQGGNLTILASEVELENGGFITSATQGPANAGDIRINTERLLLRNGAEVTLSSAGTGDAGKLDVKASSILLDNKGALTAETTTSGTGGEITLQAQDVRLQRESNISTTAGTEGGPGDGGNITINTDTLVGVANSDITANAAGGKGGFIQITSQGIFGLKVREPNESTSDISAISQTDPSLNGVVEINTPDVDPSEGVVTLPEQVVDVGRLVAQSCVVDERAVARESGKFVVTGRGGLPPTPSEALKDDSVLVDLGMPIVPATKSLSVSGKQGSRISNHATPKKLTHPTKGSTDYANSGGSSKLTHSATAPIVEAQGWVSDRSGKIILTAQAPTVDLHPSGLTSAACHGS